MRIRSLQANVAGWIIWTCIQLMPLAPLKAQEGREPAITPFPMIDTEMHVGPITGIASDAEGSLIVTGSTDKSIRLFDSEDGQFIQKYILPLGEGLIGSVTALAVSPEAERILAGTVSFDTGEAFDEGSLYLIDLAGGETLGRIRRLPGAPSQIRFTPNGSLFAMSFGPNGFELRTAKGKLLLQDVEETVSAVALADGLLAVVSDGAKVRLFDLGQPEPEELEPIQIRDAGRPFSAALTDNGQKLAVGYGDRGFVDVLDLRTRRKQRLAPKGTGLTEGNLALVTWTKGEIQHLVAGGTIQTADHQNVLLVWTGGADRAPEVLPVSTDAITGIAPAGAGAAAYASADPSWGRIVVDEKNDLRLPIERHGERLDFRELPSRGFGVSADGRRVQFRDRSPDSPMLRFDISSLELDASVAEDPAVVQPSSRRIDRLLGKWRYRTDVTLASRRLELDRDERLLSADLSNDDQSLMLGTDFRLLLYDANGRQTASRRLTSAAWAVAVARDRPILVAALGDGSIRWYSLRPDLPLAELASLFVTNDDRRWVAWTADGLFAHSEFGGQDLVGYQQNGTVKAPTGTWLGLDQIYRRFHVPDAVRAVLADEEGWPRIVAGERMNELFGRLALPEVRIEGWCSLSEMPKDIATRGLARPGKVAATPSSSGGNCEAIDGDRAPAGIISLPAGTRALRLSLAVRDRGNGLGMVDTIVDGRNLGRIDPREAGRAGDGRVTVERVIPVMEEPVTVSFRAFDGSGVFTTTSPLRFAAPRAGGAVDERPVLHVVAVGIDSYKGEINPLRYAVADAQTFSDSLREVAPSSYALVEPIVLRDSAATREGVVKVLRDLAGRVRPEDAVIIYLAGHGVTSPDRRYVFVTSNVTSADPDRLAQDGIDQEVLLQLLSDLSASNVFVMLDTCYAGAFNLQGPADFANESGYFVLAASTSLQEALDSYNQKNGVFAFAVHQGLLGAAAAGNDDIDALQLGVFVRRTVPKLAAERNHRQSAEFKAAAGSFREFPVAKGSGQQ